MSTGTIALTYFDVVCSDINNYLQPFCKFQLSEIKSHSVFIVGPRRCGKTNLIDRILSVCPHNRTVVRDDDLFGAEIKSLEFRKMFLNKRHYGISFIVAAQICFELLPLLNDFEYIIVFWSFNLKHIEFISKHINEQYRTMHEPGKTMVFDVRKQKWIFL